MFSALIMCANYCEVKMSEIVCAIWFKLYFFYLNNISWKCTVFLYKKGIVQIVNYVSFIYKRYTTYILRPLSLMNSTAIFILYFDHLSITVTVRCMSTLLIIITYSYLAASVVMCYKNLIFSSFTSINPIYWVLTIFVVLLKECSKQTFLSFEEQRLVINCHWTWNLRK